MTVIVPVSQYTNMIHVHVHLHVYVHDVIGDVKRKRNKERHLRQWKNENESCLGLDSNQQHSVLRTDALPTELHVPRQLSWQGPNQTSHTPV